MSRSRSHRLTVRTPGFHPGNRSSILREITNLKTPALPGVFRLVSLRSKQRTPKEFVHKLLSQKFTSRKLRNAVFSVRSPIIDKCRSIKYNHTMNIPDKPYILTEIDKKVTVLHAIDSTLASSATLEGIGEEITVTRRGETPIKH